MIEDANRRQGEWASDSSEHLSARQLQARPPQTRNLWSSEVSSLAATTWQRVRVAGPDVMVIICQLPALHSFRRGRSDNETLTVGTLDTALAQIVRDLRVATAEGGPGDGSVPHLGRGTL